MNTVKRDRSIIDDLLEKYGQFDVVEYIKNINEGFSFNDFFSEIENTAFKEQKDNRDYIEKNKKHLIEKWLKDHNIFNYSFYYDYSIEVNQDVDLSNLGLSEFPEYINFRTIHGNFNVSNNNFESTKQFPEEIYYKKDSEDAEYKQIICDLSGNNFKEIYPYITNLVSNGIIILKDNPDLIIHYEYLTSKQIKCDEEQYAKFVEQKMKK